MAQLNKFDTHGTATETLMLEARPLEEVLRVAAATAIVEAEEESAAVSTRPTCPVFLGEPWR